MNIETTAKIILDAWDRTIKEEKLRTASTPEEAKFLYRRAELTNILYGVDPELFTEDQINESRARLRLLFADLDHCGKHQKAYEEKLRELDPHRRDTIVPCG